MKVVAENSEEIGIRSETASPSSSIESSETSLLCPCCPKVLLTTRELSIHLREHNSENTTEINFQCAVCKRILSSNSSLDRHVLVHSKERPFRCRKCNMTFTTNGNMNRHIRSTHSTPKSGKQEMSNTNTSEEVISNNSTSSNDSYASASTENSGISNRNVRKKNERNNNDLKCGSPDLSDASTSSGKSNEDGKIRRKRTKSEGSAEYFEPLKKPKIIQNSSFDFSELKTNMFTACHVCGKNDFATSALLYSHLDTAHPDVSTKCRDCRDDFNNHRVLNLHRYMAHKRKNNMPDKNHPIVGFNDLTFTDFSSGLNLKETKDATKDLADISSILSSVTAGLQTFLRSNASTPDVTQTSLDADNPVPEALWARESCDNTSAANSTTSTPPTIQTPTASESHEEEQDPMSSEFRKMKMKGEFPCRLCPVVFPNLRALKGHHRAHLGEVASMPFPCNMCVFVGTDKAALTKHLRTHNGDRPYECAICRFAFTTKANCERHVRNRHGVGDRDEVKKSMIYHPCEDPNYTPINPKKEDRKSFNLTSDRSDVSLQILHSQSSQSDRQSPPMLGSYPYSNTEIKGEIRVIDEARLLNDACSEKIDDPEDMSVNNELGTNSGEGYAPRDLSVRVERARAENTLGFPGPRATSSPFGASSNSRGSPINLAKTSETEQVHSPRTEEAGENSTAAEPNSNEEAPLDLTIDVLDLSRKINDNDEVNSRCKSANLRNNNDDNRQNNVTTAGSTNNSDNASSGIDDINGTDQRNFYNAATSQLLLTQALLKAGQTSGRPPMSLEAIYANTQMFYQNLNSITAGVGMINPLYFPTMLTQQLALKDNFQKELVRGLQLTSGGGMVEPSVSSLGFPAFPHNRDAPPPPQSANGQNDPKKGGSPLKKMKRSLSPKTKGPDSSVKMVIKNGILIPKQKQRRYRTERPFTCEHCSARFTLRSNMERHIKQQHPEFWSQRPRGGNSNRGRPPVNNSSLLQNFGDHVLNYPMIANRLEQSMGQKDYNKTNTISDEVKYAILAQHLKSNRADENDSDDELVIDESRTEAQDMSDRVTRNTSLLRGQLEGNDHSEHRGAKESESPQRRKRDENDDESREDGAEHVHVKREKSDDNEAKEHEVHDLASVSELLDNASQQYQLAPQYLSDEEGLVASNSDGNNSGSEEKSDSAESVGSSNSTRHKKILKKKKKSAYSLAPNRVICPYCKRPFPWTSSLRRHILTHTGQKPYQCPHCRLLFTTKSNCDRHLLRKHKDKAKCSSTLEDIPNPTAGNFPVPSGASAITKLSSDEVASAVVAANVFAASMTNSCATPATTTTPMSGSGAAVSSSSNFTMRNVPERPYKCNLCPSSTFSTIGNLRKHRATKHGVVKKSAKSSRPGSPDQSIDSSKNNENSDHESQSSGASDNADNQKKRPSPRSSPGPNEVPFKCYLCDSGFAERQDCLDHIREHHEESYEMLVAKGAFDMEVDGAEDQSPQQLASNVHDGDADDKKGRFPDYSNRKVVCAFCLRRFWSAEDLRRHMRTHTGERPFTCDICDRRFTLKHSMLRHRKKHGSVDSPAHNGAMSGDEESLAHQPTITPRSQQQTPSNLINSALLRERISLPDVASIATGDAAPSGLVRFTSPYDKFSSLTGQLANSIQAADQGENTENDLISNLLGIRDKSIIDKMLQASADDAAKLLGVKNNTIE